MIDEIHQRPRRILRNVHLSYKCNQYKSQLNYTIALAFCIACYQTKARQIFHLINCLFFSFDASSSICISISHSFYSSYGITFPYMQFLPSCSSSKCINHDVPNAISLWPLWFQIFRLCFEWNLVILYLDASLFETIFSILVLFPWKQLKNYDHIFLIHYF